MLIYVAISLVLVFLSIGYGTDRLTVSSYGKGTYRDEKARLALFCLVIAILTIVVGLRADTVGIDTLNYKLTYESYGRVDFDSLISVEWDEEPGYKFSMILFNKLGLPWEIYSLFMASMYLLPIAVLIYRQADNWYFALLIFVLSGLYTFSMSTMRQTTAMGLMVCSFMLMNGNKKIKSILIFLLAISFHVSALIGVLYFVSQIIPLRRNIIPAWLIVGFTVLIFAIGPLQEFFVGVLANFGREYSQQSTGGWLYEIFFAGSLLLVAFLYEKFDDDSTMQYLFKMIYLSALLLPIVRINPTLFRVYNYFSVFQILFVPKLLKGISPSNTRLFIGCLYMAVYFLIFVSSTLSSSSGVVPYSFLTL